MKSRTLLVIPIGLTLLVTLNTTLPGCGKSAETEDPEGMTTVVGDTAFGTQCPAYGTFSSPVPTQLGLWECPIKVQPFELVQPPRTLVFQADCKKKTLSLRSADHRIDTMWEVMPDGTFSFTVDGGAAVLKSDGAGHSNCVTFMAAEVTGKLGCADRDKVEIAIDAVWRLGKGTRPVGTAAADIPSGPDCTLPASCYLHAAATIHQCQ